MTSHSDENAVCPDDGQSAEWHQQIEGTNYDGSPRTNGEFIGCPFPKDEPRPVVHRCPLSGAPGVTPCCKRPVFELPHGDRITTDDHKVTCASGGGSDD